MLAAHDADELQPEAVELGPMPPGSGRLMRAVVADMRLCMGLRLAVGDERPLPYSASFAVRRGVAPDKPAASKLLGRLVRSGVFAHVGNLPPRRPGIDGTKLYASPGGGRRVLRSES